jgi:5-methylcytosine-specific restriction endonuclease McrA
VLPITPFPTVWGTGPNKCCRSLAVSRLFDVRALCKRMFVSAPLYDWAEIAAYYETGHSVRECRARFGFSNGAWDAAVRRGDVRARPRSTRLRPSAPRRAVADLLDAGLTQAEVARRLGLSPATVSYHARRLGVATRSECARRYDWSEVQRYYDEGHSIAECRRRFGMANRTFTDAVRRGAIITRPQAVPMADLLVAGRPRCRSHVKGRLLRSGLKVARCEECGIERWRERPLSLELHHVNGDGRDNRLENLRLLCPNCHSQTANWGGRGKRERQLSEVA